MPEIILIPFSEPIPIFTDKETVSFPTMLIIDALCNRDSASF